MDGLFPIIRRKRRPLIEQESVLSQPSLAAVVAPAPLTATPLVEVIPTEPSKSEVSNDDAPQN
jgi:hypothetical protein